MDTLCRIILLQVLLYVADLYDAYSSTLGEKTDKKFVELSLQEQLEKPLYTVSR